MWMVRAGGGGYLYEDFKIHNVVAVGWPDIGNLSNFNSYEDLKSALRNTYPDFSEGKLSSTAGQLNRFKNEFKNGDFVITYNSEARIYLVGEIESNYEFDRTRLEFFHIRKVKWVGEIPRDSLSLKTKNVLGSILTIFEIIGYHEKEIISFLKKKRKSSIAFEKDGVDFDLIKQDASAKAHEFIKDKILSLDWEEMQDLVAGILRGMDYKTRVSAKGPDRGRDIFASPDGLGLEEPRIIVEVKHRKGSIGSEKIRSFTGGLRAGDKGLYVSTGGFTKEGKYEAERSNIPLTLIDSDMLVDLLCQYYENMDVETKALIPLRKIYWPV